MLPAAELRLLKDFEIAEVTFEHEAECPWMRELEEREEAHASALIDRIADILDEEPDLNVVLLTLAFVVGAVCEAVSEESASSLAEVADRFEGKLKRLLDKTARVISEPHKRDEAA